MAQGGCSFVVLAKKKIRCYVVRVQKNDFLFALRYIFQIVFIAVQHIIRKLFTFYISSRPWFVCHKTFKYFGVVRQVHPEDKS